MKRTIFTIVLGVLAMMFFMSPVLASSSISLSPSSINVKEGQSFDVAITVNPKSVNNYTVKLQLQYPADILNLESFTFSDNWMAFSGTGYDLIDNTNGALIKTAGFPSGVSTLTPFGTASFSVNKGGEGVIKVEADSFVLDGSSKNVFDGFLKETVVKITTTSLEDVVVEAVDDGEIVSKKKVIDKKEKVISDEDDPKETVAKTTTSTEEEATSSPALFDILTSPAAQQVQKRSYLTTFWVITFILLSASYFLHRRRNKRLYSRRVEKEKSQNKE